MSRYLIIDDDLSLCRSLQLQLEEHGHTVEYAGTGADGVSRAEASSPDLILLDLQLPDGSGLGFLPALTQRTPAPIAVITGRQDMQATIDAMRHGAFDYLRKPFDLEEVLLLLQKARRARSPALQAAASPILSEQETAPNEIVGSDPKIIELIKHIGLLSRTRVTALIEGESGTGKELVARALHEASTPGEPFVAINCSAVVATLLESELFGHERGAFTGAENRKLGKVETAGEGTLFLDEIGDMALSLQAKILRVLQERQFERVGGTKSIPFRARVIAATHRDLRKLVSEGKFREDLMFRLSVSRLSVPPLRERRRDIRRLAQHLLARIGREVHHQVRGISEEAMKELEQYDWPGNVREMENVLTRALVLSRGEVLTAEDLALSLHSEKAAPSGPEGLLPLKEVEKRHIEKALLAHQGNITQTAKTLGISPTTLRKKIADYGLPR